MTGFADLAAEEGATAWTWEARSVNGRGLDLRLRLPEGMESLEAPLRAAAGQVLSRGSVTVSLRLGRGRPGAARPELDADALEAAVAAALAAGEAAARCGLDLAPMTAADLLSVPGVIAAGPTGAAGDPDLLAAIRRGIEPLLAALAETRRAEGGALARPSLGPDRPDRGPRRPGARDRRSARRARRRDAEGPRPGAPRRRAARRGPARPGARAPRRQGGRHRGTRPARRSRRRRRGSSSPATPPPAAGSIS